MFRSHVFSKMNVVPFCRRSSRAPTSIQRHLSTQRNLLHNGATASPRTRRHRPTQNDSWSPAQTSWFFNLRLQGIHSCAGTFRILYTCSDRLIYISSAVAHHGHVTRPKPGTGCVIVTHFKYSSSLSHNHSIKIHFEDSKGTIIKTVEANEGDDLLSVAHEHDIDLEGACNVISSLTMHVSNAISRFIWLLGIFHTLLSTCFLTPPIRGMWRICCMLHLPCYHPNRILWPASRTRGWRKRYAWHGIWPDRYEQTGMPGNTYTRTWWNDGNVAVSYPEYVCWRWVMVLV